MGLLEKRLQLLDYIFFTELTVDDLRRIIKVFRFVEYQMELEGEGYLDCYDQNLKDRLERKYRVLLKEGGIDCF